MKKYFSLLFPAIVLFAVSCKKSGSDDPATGGTGGLGAPPASLGLSSYYKKYVDVDGIPVVSSASVPDQALLNAQAIMKDMLTNLGAAKAKMILNHLRVGIIGKNEKPTQMPEYNDLYTAFPGTDWDNRARAYGATKDRPLTTNCEENMLCQANDRYKGEEILTHEFSHAIHELGLRFSDPSFDSDLQTAFNNAKTKGLWTNTYAISDIREYWAEGVQDWFNCNLEASPANGVHNSINTRTELQTYDPMLYALIAKYFAASSVKHGCY